jgi:pyruvate,orthophosphate dikinase
MKTAIAGGRTSRPGIKLGICGEHGGDPRSVEFCHQLGLDYVSCSPYRVAIARLAAAQAAIAEADAKPPAAPKKAVTARVKTVKSAKVSKVSKSMKRTKPAPKTPSGSRKKR